MLAMFDPIALMVVVMLLFVAIPLLVALFVFWLWMLVSAVQNQGLNEGEKIAWVLILVFVHLLGAILYFFIGHPKRHVPLPPGPG